MFLAENQVDTQPQYNESILEAVIGVLEAYGEDKADMMKAESQFLVAQASGALAEAEGGEEAAKEGLKAKAGKVMERIKAFFVRVLAAIRRGIQGIQAKFGLDKKWLDKNLAAVKAVKSQTKLKAEVVDNGVHVKMLNLLGKLRAATAGVTIPEGVKTEWAELTKGLISIEELSAQDLAKRSLLAYNYAIATAKSAEGLEANLKSSEGKAKEVVSTVKGQSADDLMSYLTFLSSMASSALVVSKRIKNAAMSGMKRALSVGGDAAAEAKPAEAAKADEKAPEAKAESAFDLLESEFNKLLC